MNKSNLKYLLLLFASIIFQSCINIDQQTVINEDGSGTIFLHYSTRSSNLSMGDEIGGFSFSEEQIRKNYTSLNSDVTELKTEVTEADSTTHVRLKISFKDFNKLPEAKGFSNSRTEWKKGDDKYIFSYTLVKDTVSADKLASGEYKLIYRFTFPDEVIVSNGVIDGNSVSWEKSLSQLKEDINMTAEIKNETGVCGLFGIELPGILLLGLMYSGLRFRRHRLRFGS
ncbi:MAG: hypothetical protein IPM38_09280 [Ignavibacteria bacterium]|nr:hypothetical protein [Ignavibacteria bacterium]